MTNGPAGSAAGTALGMETVQEFRVETNAYSAEFGRMSGGQINVLTKAGSNALRGSAYEFHRNDALDAKNYFDVGGKPPFTRNQFGGAVGGPMRRDKLFYFVGYEALRENLGPHDHLDRARRERAPRPAAGSGQPGQFLNVGVNPASRRTWPNIRGQRREPRRRHRAPQLPVRSDARSELRAGPRRLQPRRRQPVLRALHPRRCRSVAADRLPAVPARRSCRAISSSPANTAQVLHVEHARHLSRRLQPHARRAGRSRPTPHAAAPFVPGRAFVGNIDVGGLKRFGTQSSVDVRFLQQVHQPAGRLGRGRAAGTC